MGLPKRPIRIALLGDITRYFSYFIAGVQEGAVRNGCWYRPIDIRQPKNVIANCLNEFVPDLLFVHCLFTKNFNPEEKFDLLAGVRRKYGTKVLYHLGDARTEPRHPHNISTFVDAALVNQTGNIPKFENIWKIKCYHWPYACFYQKQIADPVSKFKHDLVFTGKHGGGGVHADRTKFINDLQKIMKVKIYPDTEYPDTKLLTADISASAKAVLGVCVMNQNIYLYTDVRPVQFCGSGGFLMQYKNAGMEKMFENEKHLVWFEHNNPGKFVELYNRWMKCPSEVTKVRKQGFEFCQKHHSCQRRIEDIINIVYCGQKDTKILLNTV